MSAESMVRELLGLASPQHGDRAALAALRRAGASDAQRIAAAPYVLPHIPEKERESRDFDGSDGSTRIAAYFNVATLFAIWANAPATIGYLASNDDPANHKSWKYKSVGWMMRALVSGNEDAMERRFVTLLNARGNRLFFHLRQVFLLLGSSSTYIPLDFALLHNHLLMWDTKQGDGVRLRWAQDFYPPLYDNNDSPKANQ